MTLPDAMAPLPLTLSNWIDRLPGPVRAEVLGRTTQRRLGAGQFLWTRGDSSREMCQLVRGRVRVYTLSPGGKELLYIEFAPGDCFGEQTLLDGLPRHHMFQAHTEVRLRVLDGRHFDALLAAHPQMSREVLAMLSRRIRIMYEYYDAVALLPVPRRIAARLLMLAEFRAVGEAATDRPVDLLVTQEDIGYMVAATRQSVNRVMADWQRAGIVELRYGSVVVLDLDRLRELAND